MLSEKFNEIFNIFQLFSSWVAFKGRKYEQIRKLNFKIPGNKQNENSKSLVILRRKRNHLVIEGENLMKKDGKPNQRKIFGA